MVCCRVVSSSNLMCCKCCTLTQATVMLGLLYVISNIICGVAQMWILFAVNLAIVLFFLVVCIKCRSTALRCLLFFMVTILQLVMIVLVVYSYVAYVATGDWVEEKCEDEIADEDSFESCKNVLHTLTFFAFLFFFFFQLILGWCELQILYYGWREQEVYQRGAGFFAHPYNVQGEGSMPSALPVVEDGETDAVNKGEAGEAGEKGEGEEAPIGETVKADGDDSKAKLESA